jgi:hypothetical protein
VVGKVINMVCQENLELPLHTRPEKMYTQC